MMAMETVRYPEDEACILGEESPYLPFPVSGKFKGKSIILRLDRESLVYTFSKTNKAPQRISFREIIGVLTVLNSENYSLLHVHLFSPKGGGLLRKVKTFSFPSSSLNELKSFIPFLRTAIYDSSFPRPKKVFALINPFGGNKKALKLYNDLKHLLAISGIQTTEQITQYRGHVKDIVGERDLENFDVLLCVGGDGLINETVNALTTSQPVSPNFLPIPIATLPAGSQNALAISTSGYIAPIAHLFNLIRGYFIPMDAVSVTFGESGRSVLSLTCIAYGQLATILKDSENYRWMGPTRYVFSGIKKWFSPKFYPIKIRYLPPATPEEPDPEWKFAETEVFNFLAFNISG